MSNELNLAQELFDLIEKRKLIERREKELKEHFNAKLNESKILMVGSFLFSSSERNRIDFDRQKLRDVLGERIKEFEKVSTYSVLDLKKVA